MKRCSLFCAGWWPFLALPLLLLIPLLAFQWRSIEQDVAKNAEQALRDNQVEWAEVETFNRGRDALLTGSAPSTEAINKAIQITAAAEGVRHVTHNGDPIIDTTPVTQPELSIIITGESVVLRGTLKDESEVQQLVAQANSVFGEEYVVNKLLVGENIAPLPAGDFISSLAGKSLGLNTLIASLNGDTLTLKGDVASAEAKQEIFDSIRTQYTGNIDDQLEVVIIPPAEPESKIDENTLCQQKFNDLLAKGKINFATGKADITPDSLALMNNIVETAKQCPKAEFEVAGHTDSTGALSMNLSLSERRAQSVVDYLVAKGIDTKKFTAKGYGPNQPIGDNSTEEGRAKNRRIEFHVKALKLTD